MYCHWMFGKILHSDIALVILQQHRIKQYYTIDLVDRHQRSKRPQMQLFQQ